MKKDPLPMPVKEGEETVIPKDQMHSTYTAEKAPEEIK